MKKKTYDVFVIGSGVAGQTVAKICVENNMKVAISEIREFGGTCANRGCDPKKILLQFSDLLTYSEQLKENGVTSLPKIDWNQVQEFKEKLIGHIPEKTEAKLEKLKIDKYQGDAKFMNNTTLSISGKEITAKYIVIATGKVPIQLPIEGAQFLKTSEDILNLKKIPKSVAFIGGGYIGMEFANMLLNLGCKVTILQKGTEVLTPFDSFLVDKLVQHLEKKGAQFIFEADVEKITKKDTALVVAYTTGNNKDTVKVEIAINSIGRKPAIDQLELQNTSVKFDKKGIQVNDYMQSISCPHIFACGDVSDKSLPLTPLSGLQGYIAGNNIITLKSKKFEYPLIPSTVFTYPNLSTVGLSEQKAKEKYTNPEILKGDLSDTFNPKKENLSIYAYKIIVDSATDLIVGAHLIGPNANENINLLALAIAKKITRRELKKMIFSYPSYTNDIRGMLKK
ncbi:dihydrolipoyl dehydrogenase family protein [Aquimarina agarivorans]|uniref:dihydrolipoyl dehydrogenase family protein n=1 Tax=Aquimarina agarivorans TaxID=980584 RepID=UPI000248F59C|nr:NAD(P)/FAD-dependent oxidoreductase [Aquimarina agarivorans]